MGEGAMIGTHRDRGLKLFGVRIIDEGGGVVRSEEEEEEEVVRKSRSLGNLAACDASQAAEVAAAGHGYHSDGGLGKSLRRRGGSERKRGLPWTEEEHRTFLAGLEKLGKGDWRGIAKKFVTTRTSTQVASHAQKYFLRQSNPNRRKRRSSLFDVVINDKAANDSSTQSLMKNSTDYKADTILNSEDYHMVNIETKTAPPTAEVCPAFQLMLPTVVDINHMVNIETKTAPPTAEVCPAFQLMLPNVVDINRMARLSSIPNLHTIQPLSFFPAVGTIDPSFYELYMQGHANSFVNVPCLRKLSINPPQPCPTSHNRSTAASPPIDSSDLELSIAPPRSPRLTKLSSTGAAGVISVV